MTFEEWKKRTKANRPSERLGQAFVSDYIKGVWTELFYEADDKKAEAMIVEYLQAVQYFPNVPPAPIDTAYQIARQTLLYGVENNADPK